MIFKVAKAALVIKEKLDCKEVTYETKTCKKLLFSAIEATAEYFVNYVNNEKSDFIRTRKLSFSIIIKTIIGMESKSITNELIDLFPDIESLPSASAFVQQRQKIKVDAFKSFAASSVSTL